MFAAAHRMRDRARPGPSLEIPRDKGTLRAILCLFHIGARYVNKVAVRPFSAGFHCTLFHGTAYSSVNSYCLGHNIIHTIVDR